MKSIGFLFTMLILSLPLVVHSDDDATDGGGYDEGYPATTTQFGVGTVSENVNLFSGGSSVTIPLCMIRGTAGFEYDLNLGHSGPASPYLDPREFGLGWFFSTPYIERQDSPIRANVYHSYVDQPEDNRYWLILPEGSFEIVRDDSWSTSWDNTWHTTKEAGIEIECTGINWEWDTFTVSTKNGYTYTFVPIEYHPTIPDPLEQYDYGELPTGLADEPMRWGISSIEDTFGNCIDFVYSDVYIYATSKFPPISPTYKCIEMKSLESIELTQGSAPNLRQVIEIETEEREDLEWDDDGGYFNFGGTYPQRIEAVKVYEPTGDGTQGDLAYAFWFEYTKLIGFGHPQANGDEDDDYIQIPRQEIVGFKQFGSNYDSIADPESSTDYVAYTTFEYDAFDWGYGGVPADWDPDIVFGSLKVPPTADDIGFSYGIENVNLPSGGSIDFIYEREWFPDASEVVDDEDYEYPDKDDPNKSNNPWTAVVTHREGPGGIYNYNYNGKEVYGFDRLDIIDKNPLFPPNFDNLYLVLNGQLGFATVNETHDEGDYYDTTYLCHKFRIGGGWNDVVVGDQTDLTVIFEDGRDAGGIESHFYRQFIPIVGLEYEQIVKDKQSYPYNSIKTQFHYHVTVENEDYENNDIDDRSFRYRLLATTTTKHDTEGSGDVVLRSRYEYDNYENVTQSYDMGDINVSGDETCTEWEFWFNGAVYVHDKWISETVYNALTIPRTILRKTTRSWSWPGCLVNERKYITFSPGAGTYLETTYEYNTTGDQTYNLEQKIGPGNRSTHYEYDAHIPYLVYTEENALEQITSTKIYYDNGLLKQETDANGNTTSYAYDKFGRVVAVWQPGDDGFNPSNPDPEEADIRYTYDVYEEAPYQQTLIEHTQPDSTVYKTIYAYDGYGRLMRRYSPFEIGGDDKTLVEEF
jgi:YD repeat-containing protein